MPEFDFRSPRLFVDAALAADETVELERDQSNYLGNVLRLATGATVLVFNGRHGEWQAALTDIAIVFRRVPAEAHQRGVYSVTDLVCQ